MTAATSPAVPSPVADLDAVAFDFSPTARIPRLAIEALMRDAHTVKGSARALALDGVVGAWYGKTPGLDRSGDVMKHANAMGAGPKLLQDQLLLALARNATAVMTNVPDRKSTRLNYSH